MARSSLSWAKRAQGTRSPWRPACPNRAGCSQAVFKGPDTDINLHVFTVGCEEIEQMLLFRDWLRSHPDERRLYAAKKRELAKQEWKFVQNYADAKTGIVHEILARARAANGAGA